MKASMKIMAAGVVAVMLMAGIAGTLAYTAKVTNSGNNADVQATDIGFFKITGTTTQGDPEYTECTNGKILKSIHLDSERTHNGTSWNTVWTLGTGSSDKEFVESGVLIRKVSGDDISTMSGVTLTITGVTNTSVTGNDLEATLTRGDPDTTGYVIAGTPVFTTGKITITFSTTTEGKPIVIDGEGMALSIAVKDGATLSHFVDFSISTGDVTVEYITPTS